MAVGWGWKGTLGWGWKVALGWGWRRPVGWGWRRPVGWGWVGWRSSGEPTGGAAAVGCSCTAAFPASPASRLLGRLPAAVWLGAGGAGWLGAGDLPTSCATLAAWLGWSMGGRLGLGRRGLPGMRRLNLDCQGLSLMVEGAAAGRGRGDMGEGRSTSWISASTRSTSWISLNWIGGEQVTSISSTAGGTALLFIPNFRGFSFGRAAGRTLTWLVGTVAAGGGVGAVLKDAVAAGGAEEGVGALCDA